MLFKDFFDANKASMKECMSWNNYGLNDVVLEAQDALKEQALILLRQNYGKFDIGETGDILDEMQADISTNFPILMRSLSVSTSMTFKSTSQTDREHELHTITETGTDKNASTATNNSSRETKGKVTTSEDNSVLGEITNTGTVGTVETSERNETDKTVGTNTTNTQMTGSKSVSLTHSMPEQAINGVTQNFPLDEEGTPELNAATAQSATEDYSTINPLQNTAAVDSTTTVKNSITNGNTRTDDTKQITDNTSEAHTTNDATGQETLSGGSTIEAKTETVHSTTDEINRELVNKQYAQEITDILKNVHNVNSFQIWVDSFYWLCGVV